MPNTDLEKLINGYHRRLTDHETLMQAEEVGKRVARRLGDPFHELAIRSAEIRRRADLVQLCTQIIKDLESLT